MDFDFWREMTEILHCNDATESQPEYFFLILKKKPILSGQYIIQDRSRQGPKSRAVVVKSTKTPETYSKEDHKPA